jgi:hypothetical protein
MKILPEIEKHLTIATKNGEILKVCLGVMLFYQEAETRQKREVVLALFEEHATLTGERYRWTQNPKTKKWKPLKNGRASYLQPKDWLPDTPDGKWSFIYHAGKKSSNASNIEFVTYNRGSIHPPNTINYVLLQFPVELFDDAPIGLPELTQRWCALLKPKHGYAGLCLGRSHGYEHNEAVTYEYKLGTRFPGLDIRWPLSHSMELDKGIKGADWLTVLSGDYIKELGGMDVIKSQMGSKSVLEYDGGAILQASIMPQLGDVEQGIDIPSYKEVGAIIEPLRVKDYPGINIGSAPRPCFSKEEYQQWLARFSPQPK